MGVIRKVLLNPALLGTRTILDHLCGKAKAWQKVRLHGGHATQKRLAAVLAWTTKIVHLTTIIVSCAYSERSSHTPPAKHHGAR